MPPVSWTETEVVESKEMREWIDSMPSGARRLLIERSEDSPLHWYITQCSACGAYALLIGDKPPADMRCGHCEE